MAYFDEPRNPPRYRGISNPVGRNDQIRIDLARRQAIHRAFLDWANSPDREHWVPSGLTAEVEEATSDFFIRGKVTIVARMVGRPVLPMPPEEG